MDSKGIGDAILGIVQEQVKEAAEAAIRSGISYIAEAVEGATGHHSVPAAVFNACAPILAEMAVATLDGELTDPDTGRLNKRARAQFEGRLYQTLDSMGFLQRF